MDDVRAGNGRQARDGVATVVEPKTSALVAPDGRTRPEKDTPRRPEVELIGKDLRVCGQVATGRFARLSDLVNTLDGFQLHEAVVMTKLGKDIGLGFPELYVRLDDVSIVGQVGSPPAPDDARIRIPKEPHLLIVMTVAHLVYGSAHVHPEASLASFLAADEPRFIPMTRVSVRWLGDGGVAARYPFALVQRRHVIGVATHINGSPRARRRTAAGRVRRLPVQLLIRAPSGS